MTRRFKRDKLETPWRDIGDVLPSVLHSIVKKKNSRPKNIDGIWRSIVPSKYIKFTSVEKVEGDTLFVKVSSGAVYSELVMVGDDEMVSLIQKSGAFPSIKRVMYRR